MCFPLFWFRSIDFRMGFLGVGWWFGFKIGRDVKKWRDSRLYGEIVWTPSCGFQFRIAVSQRDPMRRTKKGFFRFLLNSTGRMNPGLRSGVLSPEEEQSLWRLVLHGIRDETPITMGWVPTLPWMILNRGRLHREGPLIMQKIDKNLRYNFAVGRLTKLILIDLFCFKAIFSG